MRHITKMVCNILYYDKNDCTFILTLGIPDVNKSIENMILYTHDSFTKNALKYYINIWKSNEIDLFRSSICQVLLEKSSCEAGSLTSGIR